MKRIIALTLSLLSISLFADAKADQIIKATLELKAPNDMVATSTMTITDRSGVVKMRKLKEVSKDTAEGTRAYVEFVEPADVNGTKFLTVSRKGAATDQRIFLPALKKVRKISSSGKDSEFLGSDLTYFDMEKRYFEDGIYTFLAEGETLDGPGLEGLKLTKISTVFKDPNAPYSKIISWIDPVSNVAYRVDAYDKKDGAILKTITIDEMKTIKGYSITTKTTIVNHKKGSKTVLSIGNIAVDSGVKDSEVSLKRLEE